MREFGARGWVVRRNQGHDEHVQGGCGVQLCTRPYRGWRAGVKGVECTTARGGAQNAGRGPPSRVAVKLRGRKCAERESRIVSRKNLKDTERVSARSALSA